MSIAEELEKDYGIKVIHTVVAGKLEKMGYSKQLNQKMLQVGKSHLERDAQFEYINATSKKYLSEGIPVISIDCKKKEKTSETSRIMDGNAVERKMLARCLIMIF